MIQAYSHVTSTMTSTAALSDEHFAQLIGDINDMM